MDEPRPIDTTAIGRTEKFRRLSQERNLLGATLAIIMATVYFTFIFTVAFAPAELGLPIYVGAVVSVGVAAGVAIMTLALALTIVYVVYASRRLDPMVDSIRKAAQ
ncbi:DUF485 domain-containing protein [Rhizobium mesoamericanum]|uniref:DUF485 domain-containing protein n=1 Tax=Rhizobium mesoamericanum TaxID=1079800 RepID=UPI00041AFEBB|nr:DUF485 domain-containing protein [Rhizobium mesoamericanum]